MPVYLPPGRIQTFILLAEEGAIYASSDKVLSSMRTTTFLFVSVAPKPNTCVGRPCYFHSKPKANIKRKTENLVKSSPEPKPICNPGASAVPVLISYTSTCSD